MFLFTTENNPFHCTFNAFINNNYRRLKRYSFNTHVVGMD